MITPYVPYPLHSGGQIRTWNLVKRLNKNHDFTLVCFYREEKEKKHIEILEKIFTKVYFVKKKKPWTFGSLIKSTGKYPLLMNLYDSKDCKELLSFLLKDEKFDLIHCEPFYVMQNLPEKIDCPLILVEHNIEYLAYQRYSENKKFPIIKSLMKHDVSKIKKWEEAYWRKANKVIAVSEKDKKIMVKAGIDGVEEVPNGVDINSFPFIPKVNLGEKIILYVGDFKWFQNVDAATYLVEKIWPIIKIKWQFPEKLKLLIVGKDIPAKFYKWKNSRIELIKNAPNILSYYHNADLLLAPIRAGSGTKYKILEAMASGCPVLTTKIGIEGIDGIEGIEFEIGDNEEELAVKAIDIINNKKNRESMVGKARKLVENKYSWERISKELDNIYSKLK